MVVDFVAAGFEDLPDFKEGVRLGVDAGFPVSSGGMIPEELALLLAVLARMVQMLCNAPNSSVKSEVVVSMSGTSVLSWTYIFLAGALGCWACISLANLMRVASGIPRQTRLSGPSRELKIESLVDELWDWEFVLRGGYQERGLASPGK